MSQRSSISRLSSMKREWTDEPAATAISASAPVLSKSAREIKEVITIDSDDSEANGEVGADSWPASPKPNRTPSASAPQPAVTTSQLSPRSRRRLAMFGPVPATTSSTSNKRPLEDDWDPLVSSAPRKKLTVSNGGREATPRQKTKGPVELSTQQKKVIEMAMTGTNVFFTGSAGTGKSVLLRQLIKTLKAKHNTRADAVAVTASTGIAACNVAGQTLHSFAGIGLGVDPADKLAAKVRKNQKAMSRWMRTKVLIIDEISMVDGNLFDKLSKIGTILRRDQHPFGGIQIIATGDFFQLPPVSKGSNLAKFAFEAQMWKETIHRTVNLTQVFRQKDERFVDMLNEMRFGSLSTRSIARFKQLSRAVLYEDGIEPTELYPRREEVDTANSVRLRQLDSEEKHYTAHDSGAITDAQQLQKELSNLLAVPLLHLKVGCQVMLIKNLDEDLVNGSIGRVEGFYSEEDWPHIKNEFGNENFNSEAAEATLIESRKTMLAKPKRQAEEERGGQVFPAVRFVLPGGDCIVRLITREQFQIEEPNGTVKASRVQLPLILSWAMSIHKSQGQTIERVKVDLRRIFEKGQAYVALSRATSLDSLQVLNFDERKVMVHEKVARFSHSLETLD